MPLLHSERRAVCQGQTLTIRISDEHLLNALVQGAVITAYDEDGTPSGVGGRGLDLYGEVKRVVQAEVSKILAVLVRDRLEAIIDERFRAALDEGFPVVSKWGDPTGEKKSFRQLIGEAVLEAPSRSGGGDGLVQRIAKVGRDEADKIVRETVRSLQGELVESMRASAAEALAGFVGKALSRA